MVTKFHIKLKAVHEESGKTAYRVWKDTGISHATVAKYTADDIIVADYLPTTVIQLAKYYQVDWRDPKIIEIVEDDEEKETKRPELALSTA